MKKIDKTLFPDESKWLDGSFRDITEMFGSFEYFASYIKKRYPAVHDSQVKNYRGAFLIEEIDVVFLDPKSCPRKTIHLGFAENKLTIQLPDVPGLTDEEKDTIRDQYQMNYAPVVKESHTRAMTLLWKLLGQEAREELKNEFRRSGQGGGPL